MGITQEISSQSITGHQPSSHRSLDLENFNTGESQYSPVTGHQSSGHRLPVSGHQTLYQSIISETHVMGIEFTNNPTSSKGVLLPLEPGFNSMSDPSFVVEPPDNNWRSVDRQVSQTFLSRRISRKDQSRNIHKSKKRRRRRSSSTSSSLRSVSSDSRKRSRKSKRSKHSHKKRRKRYVHLLLHLLLYYLIISPMIMADKKEVDKVRRLHRILVYYSMRK